MGERYPTADKHKAVMSAHTQLADVTAFFMPYVRMVWRLQCDCFLHALCAHDLTLTKKACVQGQSYAIIVGECKR